MRPAPILLAVCMLVVIPSTDAQMDDPPLEVPTTLYLQMFDTLAEFYITRAPPTEYPGVVVGIDYPTVSNVTDGTTAIRGRLLEGTIHDPSKFVERDDGAVATGTLRPTELTGDAPMVHLFVRLHPPTHSVERIGVEPARTFRLRVFDGQPGAPPGAVLMEGSLTAHLVDVSGMSSVLEGVTAPDGYPILVPDVEGVIEVSFPLSLRTTTIPEWTAFHTIIDWWEGPEPSSEWTMASTSGFRFVSDATHTNRIDLAVLDPFEITYVHPEVAASVLLIHTGLDSLWGRSDLDTTNATLTITGPSDTFNIVRVLPQGSHVHPIPKDWQGPTYLWRFREDEAKDGVYRIVFQVQDREHTHTLTTEAGFVLNGKEAYGVDANGERVQVIATESNGSPAPVAAGILAGILLLARVRRR